MSMCIHYTTVSDRLWVLEARGPGAAGNALRNTLIGNAFRDLFSEGCILGDAHHSEGAALSLGRLSAHR